MINFRKSRKYNLISNSVFGVLSTIVSVLMIFVVRMTLSKSVGPEVYGINTLFTSLANALLLMELGIGTAIVIFLYEPIANKNKEKIKTLVRFYRNVYLLLTLVVIILGLLIACVLLPILVKNNLKISYVQISFILFLVSSISKSFGSYKRCVLLADQKYRVFSVITTFVELFFGVLQVYTLLITKNYLYFICLLIFQNVTVNVLCNYYVDKHYYYLKEKLIEPIKKNEVNAIKVVLKPLVVQKIAGVVQDSGNTLVVSFISRTGAIVGYFGNYLLVASALQLLFSQVGIAFTSGFGNLATERNTEKNVFVFENSRFIMNFFATLISICYIVLIDDFIIITFGSTYVLTPAMKFVMGLSLYFKLNDVVVSSVQNALGLHNLDKVKMIYQAVFSCILSVIGGTVYGMEGVILGSLAPVIIFTTFYKGIVICRSVFQFSVSKYIYMLFFEFIRYLLSLMVTYTFISNLFFVQDVFNWMFNATVSIVIVSIVFFVLSYRCKETKYFKKMIKEHRIT